MNEEKDLVYGAASGGITDPNSDNAERHAELFYEEIRHRSTDVKSIAERTGFTYEQILIVKNYLFVDCHILSAMEPPRRFDACFEIAESWRRLSDKNSRIEPHDILLINHELKEIALMAQGLSQSDAHDMTEKMYNYTEAAMKYYGELRKKEKISGAITNRLGSNTH